MRVLPHVVGLSVHPAFNLQMFITLFMNSVFQFSNFYYSKEREKDLSSSFYLPTSFILHFPLSSLFGGQRGGQKEKERKREEEEEERGKRGRGKSPTRSLSCTRIATSESLSPRMLRSFTLAEGERKSQPIQFIHLLHLSSCSYTLYCSPDPMIVSLSSTIMHLLCTYTISVILRK